MLRKKHGKYISSSARCSFPASIFNDKTKLVAFACILIISLSLIIQHPTPIHASVFNPSLILSDYEFEDVDSMTISDISRFLSNKGSALTDYTDPTTRVQALQLIYDNAQLNRINPKVLLVTLQKEQSLITDATPSQDQYNWATGYAICDACSKSDPSLQKYKGFASQVDYAASALRLFYDNPYDYGFTVGSTQMIDGQSVTISNAATHALYIYTPHRHGNENFHRIYQEWFSKDFPDGTLLQNAETGGIFIIQNGAKRPFTSMLAFASRYDLNKVVITSPINLGGYPDGPPIKYAQYSLLQDNTTGGIYLIVDDKKRPITSREAFRQIGFNPEEVVPVDPQELDLVATGKAITVANAHPTGVLLQEIDTGGVWFIQDNVRHAIWSREIMDANFSKLTPIPANPVDIAVYSLGDPVKFNDGELVKADDHPAVFVISNGFRRPIVSGEVFEKLGYKWENIIVTSAKTVSLHPQGEVVDFED